jgi:tripartite-type tricarboxylate transporter receptor subunit TctC
MTTVRRVLARCAVAILVLAAALASVQPASAQPASPGSSVAAGNGAGKPVHWVVPWPPGGPLDASARVIGQRLAEQLGVPVLVDNRPGAQGNVGTEWVARGPVDGSVLLMAVPGLLTNPWLMRNSVNPEDLAPVVKLTSLAFVLLAHPSFAPRTLDSLIEAIRRQPGTVSCGASGSLPAVGCLMLSQLARTDMLQVPYRGNGPALNALVAGEINLLFDVSSTAVPQIRSGRARAIATTASRRTPGALADVPVIAETVPGFELMGWQGVMVARGTPPGVIQRLNLEINRALEHPDVRSRLIDSGLDVEGGSAAAFAASIRSDAERYGRILKAAGIKAE